MDKKLFEFLMDEAKYTQQELEAVYNMDKQGKEIADKINNIYKKKPDSVCHVAFNGWCSRCPIKRIQQYLDDDITVTCEQAYIILQLLKEGK